jgi:hypothetical protein
MDSVTYTRTRDLKSSVRGRSRAVGVPSSSAGGRRRVALCGTWADGDAPRARGDLLPVSPFYYEHKPRPALGRTTRQPAPRFSRESDSG